MGRAPQKLSISKQKTPIQKGTRIGNTEMRTEFTGDGISIRRLYQIDVVRPKHGNGKFRPVPAPKIFLTRLHPGATLMVAAPLLAMGFGFQVFFPVGLISVTGAVICVFSSARASRLVTGQLAFRLMQDLASADADRRALVLAELNETPGRVSPFGSACEKTSAIIHR